MHMSHSTFRMVGRREEGKGEYGKRDGSMCTCRILHSVWLDAEKKGRVNTASVMEVCAHVTFCIPYGWTQRRGEG